MIGYFADQNLNLFEKFNDIDAVIDVLCDIVQRRSGCNQTKYNIQFFSCSCELSKSKRNKVLRNHKSSVQKQLCTDKVKQSYIII